MITFFKKKSYNQAKTLKIIFFLLLIKIEHGRYHETIKQSSVFLVATNSENVAKFAS